MSKLPTLSKNMLKWCCSYFGKVFPALPLLFSRLNVGEADFVLLTVFNMNASTGDFIQDRIWGADRKAALYSAQETHSQNKSLNLSAPMKGNSDRFTSR